MASAHITLGSVMGGGAPVYAPYPNASQTVTTSASSAASTISAILVDYARIVAQGGNMRIAVGSAPVATITAGYVILDGAHLDIGPLKTGDKIAAIDIA